MFNQESGVQDGGEAPEVEPEPVVKKLFSRNGGTMFLDVLRVATLGILCVVLFALPARAHYEAGRRALDAGDTAEALSQWTAAASSGDRRAIQALGRLYMRGVGVLQDYVEAHKWLNIAASRGEVAAAVARDTLAGKMTPEQVDTAQQRAREWISGQTNFGDTTDVVAVRATSATAAAKDSDAPPRRAIHEVQTLLNALGYQPGPADGIWGRRTSNAYLAFLRDAGIPLSERLTPETLRALRETAQRHGAGVEIPIDPMPAQSAEKAQVAANPEPATSVSPIDSLPRLPLREEIREAQNLLEALGYAPGPADGQWEARTVRAYEAFLLDASLPPAEALSPETLQALRDEANRWQESLESVAAQLPAPTSGTRESVSGSTAHGSALDSSLDATLHSPAIPTTAETIGAMANVVIHGIYALQLAKMIKDPESYERLAPELQKMLTKMLSGLSLSELSNSSTADISLGGLTSAERDRMSDLLKKDQGLPEETRVALGNALRADAAPVTVLEPKCAGAAEETACLREISNKRGCYIWTGGGYPNATITWSGGCSDAIADGPGTVVWTDAGKSNEWTGTLVSGKQHGHWVARYADGRVEEGPYVDDEKHGQWVIRFGSGFVHEGPFVNGKKHGHWVEREPDGTIAEGSYRKGETHGQWVLRFGSGGVWEGPLVNGKMEGHWVRRDEYGDVSEGAYVNGEMHGRWVERDRFGLTEEMTYVEGELHGRWLTRYPDGTCRASDWSHGEVVQYDRQVPCP